MIVQACRPTLTLRRSAPPQPDRVELSEPAEIGGVALPEWATRPLGFSWDGLSKEVFAAKMLEFEALLSDPEATIAERVKLGENFTNPVYLVRLSNGVVGIWKQENQEYHRALRSKIPPRQEGRREAFGYEIDQAMGHLARVPPAVYREFNGQAGTIQLFVPNTTPDAKSERHLRPEQDRYQDIAIYDHVTGNLDRHDFNLLHDPTSSIPIDQGLILPEDNEDQGAHNFLFADQVQLRQRHRDSLEDVLESIPELEEKATLLKLDLEGVEAMEERVDFMLATGATSNFWRGGDDFPTTFAEGLRYRPPN